MGMMQSKNPRHDCYLIYMEVKQLCPQLTDTHIDVDYTSQHRRAEKSLELMLPNLLTFRKRKLRPKVAELGLRKYISGFLFTLLFSHDPFASGLE